MKPDFFAAIPARPHAGTAGGEAKPAGPPADHPDAGALWNRARVPQRHRDARPDFNREPWAADTRKIIDRFARAPDFMAALIGPRGTGKTQAAVEMIRYAARRGIAGRYCTAFDFFAEIKNAFTLNRSEREVVRAFSAPGILCIDEIQVRTESIWENNHLTHLVDERYAAKRATIFVSNLDADSFRDCVGESIHSRMIETGGFVIFGGPSFRVRSGDDSTGRTKGPDENAKRPVK